MEKLKKLAMKLSRSWWVEKDSHIVKLENGYIFKDRYYPDIESLMGDLQESLNEFFDE
jgi:hypothetical protein